MDTRSLNYSSYEGSGNSGELLGVYGFRVVAFKGIGSKVQGLGFVGSPADKRIFSLLTTAPEPLSREGR